MLPFSGGMYSQLAQPFTAQPNAPFVQQNAFMVQPSMGQLGSMAAPMVMPVGNQMQANPNPMCMHANPMGSIIQPNGSGNGIQSMAQINGLTSATTMNVPVLSSFPFFYYMAKNYHNLISFSLFLFVFTTC